jgi:hypothetical protein
VCKVAVEGWVEGSLSIASGSGSTRAFLKPTLFPAEGIQWQLCLVCSELFPFLPASVV